MHRPTLPIIGDAPDNFDLITPIQDVHLPHTTTSAGGGGEDKIGRH
jgi:hypothetical protein